MSLSNEYNYDLSKWYAVVLHKMNQSTFPLRQHNQPHYHQLFLFTITKHVAASSQSNLIIYKINMKYLHFTKFVICII
jgi:hypothetical protein